MTNSITSELIKAEAKSLGFFACGIAKADAVEQSVVDSYRRWIAEGCNASMAYLENYPDKHCVCGAQLCAVAPYAHRRAAICVVRIG